MELVIRSSWLGDAVSEWGYLAQVILKESETLRRREKETWPSQFNPQRYISAAFGKKQKHLGRSQHKNLLRSGGAELSGSSGPVRARSSGPFPCKERGELA
ncbi:hypothetical protein CDAR_43181 [Caerostris darwini]|uniref:Uncharacterized protein n=1 Tax=Caerostris darwini TaxID=1538125 RepID=A0AAV4WH70_9ARAC|nr:hypothetical protein CDAR_43181 [Caerostris darwini]